MGPPQTLPANFDGWDKQASVPATLPADFNQWDESNGAAPSQPSAASRFGRSFAQGAGIMSNEDAKNFFLHPIDTLKKSFQAQGQLGMQAKQDFENSDYVRGITHAAEYMMPFLGPALAHAGSQLESGDIAGSVGTTLGVAAPALVGSPEARAAVGDAATSAGAKTLLLGRTPEEAYQSALKPSTTIPPTKVNAMVRTGLDNAIPVSKAGLEKLSSLMDDVEDKITQQIQSDPTRPINKFAVTSRLADTAKRFQTQVNPEADLAAISDAGNEFLRNQPGEIPAADAQALKRGTYTQLSSKAYGEMKSATIESQKALARGIKEELNQTFPELAGLNAKDAQFINLQDVLEKAVQRQSNHQLMGISTPMAAGAAKAVTGSSGVAAVAGMLKAIVDNPIAKSRLAIALNKAGVPYSEAISRIQNYSAQLAASSSVANSATLNDRGTGSTQ